MVLVPVRVGAMPGRRSSLALSAARAPSCYGVCAEAASRWLTTVVYIPSYITGRWLPAVVYLPSYITGILFLQIALIHVNQVSSEKGPAMCLDRSTQVYTSLLKIGNIVMEEGPQCKCSETAKNSTAWKDDNKVITWYHHERIDWLVQYRFCEVILPQRVCQEGNPLDDIPATISVSSEAWDPRVAGAVRCRCPTGRFLMAGWFNRKVNEAERWEYQYTCTRPNCKATSPCLKHYLDRAGSHTVGFKFLCTCPLGKFCPVHTSNRVYEVDGVDDHIGPYIEAFCKNIQGWNGPDSLVQL